MDDKLFKRYRRIISYEIISVLLGVVGFFFGVLSIIVLFIKSTYNKDMNLIITWAWVVLDFFSIFYSFIAIVYSKRTRKKDLDDDYQIKKTAAKSEKFDMGAILNGLIGLVFAIISIYYYRNMLLNSIFTVLTIIFDVLSVMCGVNAFYFLLTELWNVFKLMIHKAKTKEILKTRKIVEKNMKAKFDSEHKEIIKNTKSPIKNRSITIEKN